MIPALLESGFQREVCRRELLLPAFWAIQVVSPGYIPVLR